MRRKGCPRAALAAALAITTGCAVNPATGKRQLVLVSEGDEIAMGRESDKSIVAEMGLYDDDALAKYVQALGARLAAKSERPELAWSFRVVDDPIVNAFALPGGYINITRGILAHLANEAELATVIGHEIGHVTARHSVSQISKAQLAQLGLGIGSILAPEQAQRFGGMAQTGLGLLFLKYGRDDERQADDLGVRYLLATGYDPRPAAGVFDMRAAVSGAAGTEQTPAWASTHPAPEDRKERIQAAVSAMKADFAGRPVGLAEYEGHIDGLVFGEDPRQGYFKDDLFVHPELAFQLTFPPGWKGQNQRSAVRALSKEKDAVVQLTLAAEKTADEALRKFFAQQGVQPKSEPMSAVHGMPTAGDGFTATVSEGALEGRIGFVEHGGRVFQLLGYASQAAWSGHAKAIRASLASFDKLTDRRLIDVAPKKIRLIRADEALSLDAFAKRHGATVPTGTLALLNRLAVDARVQPGKTYKIV